MTEGITLGTSNRLEEFEEARSRIHGKIDHLDKNELLRRRKRREENSQSASEATHDTEKLTAYNDAREILLQELRILLST